MHFLVVHAGAVLCALGLCFGLGLPDVGRFEIRLASSLTCLHFGELGSWHGRVLCKHWVWTRLGAVVVVPFFRNLHFWSPICWAGL